MLKKKTLNKYKLLKKYIYYISLFIFLKKYNNFLFVYFTYYNRVNYIAFNNFLNLFNFDAHIILDINSIKYFNSFYKLIDNIIFLKNFNYILGFNYILNFDKITINNIFQYNENIECVYLKLFNYNKLISLNYLLEFLKVFNIKNNNILIIKILNHHIKSFFKLINIKEKN
jgi:hypothetical protein